MKLIRIIIIGLGLQLIALQGMEPKLEIISNNPSLNTFCDLNIATKVALSAVVFSSIYALADLSAGVCTKKSLWKACKDGLITAGAFGCTLVVCKEFPLNTPNFIWTVSTGFTPLLLVHSLLFKRGLGLQALDE